MDFYDRVKILVKAKNITIQGLLNELDINYETYNSQRRFNNLPRSDESVKIAQALDVTVEYLVTGKEINREEKIKEIKQEIDKIKNSLDSLL